MSDDKRADTILIREGTLLPQGLGIETDLFLPGWRVIANRDRYALTRQIEHANWSFFFLAGEIRATVLGRDKLGTLRRAAKCVLAKRERRIANCLEITRVVSKRFLGIPFMVITAHSRHIQENRFLVPVKNSVLGLRPSSLDHAVMDLAR
jgi:hypothetical protein